VRNLRWLAGLTILAAAIDIDVGGIDGVFGNCYDVMVTAATAGATKGAMNAHDGMKDLGVVSKSIIKKSWGVCRPVGCGG
jgi:hypothetical protein